MHDGNHLVVFRLDEHRYALRLDVVERIIRAVEITPLPQAPPIVLGIIDVAGDVIPVLNLRRRFGLPDREVRPEDQLLIAHTAARTVALVIDEAQDLVWTAEMATAGDRLVPGLSFPYVDGVVILEDGLVLIHDLERFLSAEEAQALATAMPMEAYGF